MVIYIYIHIYVRENNNFYKLTRTSMFGLCTIPHTLLERWARIWIIRLRLEIRAMIIVTADAKSKLSQNSSGHPCTFSTCTLDHTAPDETAGVQTRCKSGMPSSRNTLEFLP